MWLLPTNIGAGMQEEPDYAAGAMKLMKMW
jgi:hypothetical protein